MLPEQIAHAKHEDGTADTPDGKQHPRAWGATPRGRLRATGQPRAAVPMCFLASAGEPHRESQTTISGLGATIEDQQIEAVVIGSGMVVKRIGPAATPGDSTWLRLTSPVRDCRKQIERSEAGSEEHGQRRPD